MFWLSNETIRLSMDYADSSFLHVWYTTDSVYSTGKTNGIIPVVMCLFVILLISHFGYGDRILVLIEPVPGLL